VKGNLQKKTLTGGSGGLLTYFYFVVRTENVWMHKIPAPQRAKVISMYGLASLFRRNFA
jgi:hypothetical protein